MGIRDDGPVTGKVLRCRDHPGLPHAAHEGDRQIGDDTRIAVECSIADDAAHAIVQIDAWRKAGLPIVTDSRQPLELQRQVQISAGSLALGGTALGLLISPWFFIVPAFVGAGLVTAGVTGFCGMARVLMRAPWNRAVYGARNPTM